MKESCKTYLDEQFGGDAEIIGEIYAEYVSSAQGKVKEAKDALAGNAWDPLDKIAHAVKGNALAAGDQEMANVAIALRNAAKLQNSEESAGLIAQMEGLLAKL